MGGSWTDDTSDLTLGLLVSWGGDDITQPVDYDSPTEASRLLGGPSTGRARYVAVWFVVGYRYRF